MFWRNVLLRNLESLVLLASTHDSVGDHLRCKLTGEISLQKPAFYPWIEVDWEGAKLSDLSLMENFDFQVWVWILPPLRIGSSHGQLWFYRFESEISIPSHNWKFRFKYESPAPHPPTIGTYHAVYYNLTGLFVTAIPERNWVIR